MNGTPTDTPIKRRPKLSESVAQALREQILSGEFKIGERLPPESRITEIFSVSRTVVREAVALLASDGLVMVRHGAGVFVLDQAKLKFGAIASDIGNRISRAVNVLEVRMGIEIESAGLAAQRSGPSQIARIQEAFFEFERLLEKAEPTGKADFAFHREIAAATNNEFYVEIMDALGDRTIPCDHQSPLYSAELLTVDYMKRLQREHLRILQAISAHDVEAAREAMRSHLALAKERYMERLASQQANYAQPIDLGSI